MAYNLILSFCIFLSQGLTEFFHPLLSGEGILSLLTLTLMEIVLGIDNVIFISIIAGRVQKENQRKARNFGLLFALVTRIGLLSVIAWIVGLKEPLFTILGEEFSWRDIILILGGMFLIYKSTTEIHEKMEDPEDDESGIKRLSLTTAIIQIVLLDIVFSFDSILTAVGLVDYLSIMIIAVVISLIIMMLFSKMISDYVNKHPTVKMLALSFLLMIGVLLILEGFHKHIPKGYVYFAMGFSLFVEVLNLRAKKKSKLAQMRAAIDKTPKDKITTDRV